MSNLVAQVRITQNLTNAFEPKNELRQGGGHVKDKLLYKPNKIVDYEDYSKIKSPSTIIYFVSKTTDLKFL